MAQDYIHILSSTKGERDKEAGSSTCPFYLHRIGQNAVMWSMCKGGWEM